MHDCKYPAGGVLVFPQRLPGKGHMPSWPVALYFEELEGQTMQEAKASCILLQNPHRQTPFSLGTRCSSLALMVQNLIASKMPVNCPQKKRLPPSQAKL
ncbi:hypothetical protein [Noviherbaspirillum suwonense]|nr:hypothetical protein [Noviherbaspirillum suwonense]